MSGTGILRSDHCRTSSAVSSGSSSTVTASRRLGCAALAYARARIAGLCSLLASTTASRTVARVNHPDNEWLFNESWGVDVAVSTRASWPLWSRSRWRSAIRSGLFTFGQSETNLVELTMPSESLFVGTLVGQVPWPPRVVLVAILRDGSPLVPHPDRALEADDELLFVTPAGAEETELAALLSPGR